MKTNFLTGVSFLLCSVITALMISSCSSTWHLKRALKKNPLIVTHTSDTVFRNIEGLTGKMISFDSITVDNDRIKIKAKGSGKLTLDWEIKDQIVVESVNKIATITPKKTRQQVRQDNRTKRAELRNDRKVVVTEAKQQGKTKRQEIKTKRSIQKLKRSRVNVFWIAYLIGIFTAILVHKLHNRILRK